MRRYRIAPWILIILSAFNFTLAAPVAVLETHVAKADTAAPEKWMDPGDQSPMNARISTDSASSNSVTLESSLSTSEELDTPASTSKQQLSTGPHPAGNASPLHSVSTDDVPPQSPQQAPDHPPPSSRQQPKDYSTAPPSNPGPSTGPHELTDVHSPPSTPEIPPGFEDFLGKFPPPLHPGPSTGPHQPTDDHSSPSTPEFPPGFEFLGKFPPPSNPGPSTGPHQLVDYRWFEDFLSMSTPQSSGWHEDDHSPLNTPEVSPGLEESVGMSTPPPTGWHEYDHSPPSTTEVSPGLEVSIGMSPQPSNPGPSTGPHQPTLGHSPPSTPEVPPGFEDLRVLGKFMKGKFKRRISGY